MLKVMRKELRATVLAALFLVGAASVFPQDEMAQRGSIPEELLRPRRDEAPRYPIDTVIGPLGQGRAPQEAYEIAKNTAAALVTGNMDVSVLASVNRVFLEDCMSQLNAINPQFFRLGSGREEPDGSVSFLVRFVGREQGITGELFIRFEEQRPEPRPAAVEPKPEPEEAAVESELESAEEGELVEQAAEPVQVAAPVQAPPPNVPAKKTWLFEDLILEDARSREAENGENRHRYDFSPYERFF
jgi:hypothetical protein